MVANLTRRQFSLGASALAGSRGGVVSAAGAGMPGGFGVPDADDAYQILMSRYFALEEAAFAGRVPAGAGEGGAVTWEGRQLESYLAQLDMRVDVVETARQVIDGYKERLQKAVREVVAETEPASEADVDGDLPAEPGRPAAPSETAADEVAAAGDDGQQPA